MGGTLLFLWSLHEMLTQERHAQLQKNAQIKQHIQMLDQHIVQRQQLQTHTQEVIDNIQYLAQLKEKQTQWMHLFNVLKKNVTNRNVFNSR